MGLPSSGTENHSNCQDREKNFCLDTSVTCMHDCLDFVRLLVSSRILALTANIHLFKYL